MCYIIGDFNFMNRLPTVFSLLLSISCIDASVVEFNRDIRPILSDKCFSCHGLDQQKGGLRLDLEATAFKGGKSGKPAIIPGEPNHSELVARVTHTGDDRMPPPKKDAVPSLNAKQVAVLRQWITEGGKYQKHWAYEKPTKPRPPLVKTDVSHSIDRFILARLEKRGWPISPPAEKARLLRRVHLDLTGLPPTLVELDAFLAENSPDAYRKVVDRLLKSERYGEHWARQWLDLARYADSNGFQADQLRDSWAYRDWVIDAMNADMPFDQFTIEQIAGDLLPSPTLAQKIATGFHRTPTCNVEAGVDPEENRTNQVVDRVNTTGTVWLGTSLECAQCHSHKYDPFSQEDYYRIFSFFNNTPLEVQGKGGVSYNFYGPKLDLPLSGKQSIKMARVVAEINDAETALALAKKEANAGFNQWLKERKKELAGDLKKTPDWRILKFINWKSSGKEPFELLDDGSLLAMGNPADKALYTFEAKAPSSRIASIKFDALTHKSLRNLGPGRNTTNKNPNFVLSEFSVFLRDPDGKEIPLTLNGAQASFSQGSFSVTHLIDGKHEARNGWAIAPEFGKPHWATFNLVNPITPKPGSSLVFKLDHVYGGGRNIGRTLLSTSPVATAGGNKSSLPGNLVALLKKNKPTKKDMEKLREQCMKEHPKVQSLEKDVIKARKAGEEIKKSTTLVMVEMKTPRDTNVMIRGQFMDKGKKVSPGTPATLHPWDESLPENRLGFARWLVSRDNPLMARVTVNRWWGQFMGRGIVSTEEDFGSQSEPPTHPDLLDWLATEFMDNGWSMKHIHRTIVLSDTYRQSSRITPELLKQDPLNRMYARGPRFRMTAEMIRDNALQVSGILSNKMHGPPIYPPQPDGLWKQVGRNEPKYAAATDEDRFRRGIYIIWRRAAPYPSFVNFDGPDRSACHPRRSRTNTPLQALTLLNDEAYIEMALAFADSILSGNPTLSVEKKIQIAFRRTVARAPTQQEIAALHDLYETEFLDLKKNPGRATELIGGIKGYKPSPGLDPQELAAWFAIANTLLNLDETVTKS